MLIALVRGAAKARLGHLPKLFIELHFDVSPYFWFDEKGPADAGTSASPGTAAELVFR